MTTLQRILARVFRLHSPSAHYAAPGQFHCPGCRFRRSGKPIAQRSG